VIPALPLERMAADPQWFANEVSAVAAGISVLALGASAVSVYYSRRQANAGEKQATEAAASRQISERALADQAAALKEQAENTARTFEIAARNAAAAEKSADHGAQSVELGRESMYRSLRAYVTIEGIEPSDWTGFPESPESGVIGLQRIPEAALVTVTNTGQTPARHLEIQYNMDVLHEFPQTAAEYDQHYRGWMPTDLGCNQKRTVRTKIVGKGTEDKLKSALDSSMSKLLVFGRIKYLDMFSDIENVTEFCFVYDTRRELFVPAGPVNSVR
jgi:type II secretory pathway pseudopilin PulG